MSILSDNEIIDLCKPDQESSFLPMIEPFVDHQVREQVDENTGEYRKVISYGLSSAGYDVRLNRQYKIFKNTKAQVIDPLDMTGCYYDDHQGDYCIIPPNGYILGLTMETLIIPRDILVIAIGKSTWARVGAIVNTTPIEPGWKGKIVIEIANASNIPIKIHSGMGIAQLIFHRLNKPCKVSYDDRQGKYQGQNSLTTARA